MESIVTLLCIIWLSSGYFSEATTESIQNRFVNGTTEQVSQDQETGVEKTNIIEPGAHTLCMIRNDPGTNYLERH